MMSSPESSMRHLAAVWFADLVGYSRLAAEDESTALRVIRLFQAVAREQIERVGGHLVKFLGDGAFAEFASVESAVRSALAVQRAFAARTEAEGLEAALRIGVHIGDVVTSADGDLYGDGVNIAARLQAEAEPGQVLVSEDVWRQLRQRREYRFRALGERELKGSTARLAVFDVASDDGHIEAERSFPAERSEADAAPPSDRILGVREHSRRWRVVLALALVGVLGAAGLLGYLRWAAGLGSEAAAEPSRSGDAVAPTPEPERSIVVLPFLNMTPDEDNEYFSDGLTEEIITRLSAVPALKVISRTSAMHYKGSQKPLRQIADELNVAHILEGSVRQSEGRLRITAQLIDARADEHLRAENYDYTQGDIFRVQEEIAREVVRALEVELGERERRLLVRQGTRDPEAYELYRRGRYFWSTRTKEGHELAFQYYQRAIERDSTYADAYAGLADVYLTAYQLGYSSIPEAEVYSRIKWAAERALALDDHSADAHTSFAIALWWQRNWPGAERELRRAIELNPGHSQARSWYALLLSGMGRLDEALQQSRQASELNPLGALRALTHASLCYVARDYDCAIAQAGRALELNDAWAPTYAALSLAYAQKGMDEAATRAASKAVELGGPQISAFLANLAYVHARAGRRAEAEHFLQRAKTDLWEGFNIARAYVALGEPDSAFAWLERSSWRWPHRANRYDPALDPLRSDPRFAQLSARVEREMGMQ